MANTRKTIPVVFGRLRTVKTPRRTQGDYGQVLVISDAIKLPADFVVHFCNEGDAVTKTQIGHDNMVTVPPQFLKDGRDIICYVFVHDGDTDGRTMYTIRIPIVRRPDTEEIEPTPEQEDVIMQAITDKAGFSIANGRCTKLPESIDYLVIWFGWNDNAYGTLGTITDDTNESYYGGYNVVLPYLINKYPDCKIALVVPFGTTTGHRNAIRQLGNKWGVAVWDNYQGGTPLYFGKEDSVGVDSSIVTANKAKYQANGAHPNYKGHTQLADMIEDFLRGI